MPEVRASATISDSGVQHVDIAVVGAGFAGLYLLYRLRQAGFTAQGLEAADDVGGTWYWNRYPGARCDIQTTDYSFTFDPELEAAWQWSEKYATQPEILRYLGFVADRYDLRRDIRFATRVTSGTLERGDPTLAARDQRRLLGILPLLHHGERLPVRAQAARDRGRRGLRGGRLRHR